MTVLPAETGPHHLALFQLPARCSCTKLHFLGRSFCGTPRFDPALQRSQLPIRKPYCR
jgi:hypothetical protein